MMLLLGDCVIWSVPSIIPRPGPAAIPIPTHDLPDTGMGLVRSLVVALVLGHLVGGVDESEGEESKSC